jgi:hypothetical protein
MRASLDKLRADVQQLAEPMSAPASWVATIAELATEAFGADDPRASDASVRELTRDQQLELYKLAMETLVANGLANPSPELLAFKALPVVEQVRIFMGLNREWTP